jgi:AbrB family looped-hinge helix DNA binding protein
MIITIDRLGRVVIPKSVREHFHLAPGTELEIAMDTDGIHLKPALNAPTLIRKEGILIHHGTDSTDIDSAAVLRSDRVRRGEDVVSSEATS